MILKLCSVLLAVLSGAFVASASAVEPRSSDSALTAEDEENLKRLESLPALDEPTLGELDETQQAVLERVNARWKAMLAFDLKAVYAFATPNYRKTYDQLHLNSKYAAQVQRTKATPVSVRIDPETPNVARVRTKLNFRTLLPGTGQPYVGTSWVNETWSLEDGQWWFVEPK